MKKLAAVFAGFLFFVNFAAAEEACDFSSFENQIANLKNTISDLESQNSNLQVSNQNLQNANSNADQEIIDLRNKI